MKRCTFPAVIILSLLPHYALSASLSDSSPSDLVRVNVAAVERLELALAQSKQSLAEKKSLKSTAAVIATAEKDVADKQKELEKAKAEPCTLESKRADFCRLSYKDTSYFKDVAVDPTLADGADLKLGVVRGYIDFGETVKLPISVLYSKVTDSPEDGNQTANAKSLLDPEQGINIAFEYGGLFSVWEICRGDTTARCFIGANVGARYLQLKEEGTGEDISSYGGLATLKMLMAFNIFDSDIDKDNKLGTISLNAAYSGFYHNGDDSSRYFAGITDSQGNPVKFENSFSSLKLGASFSLNKSISIKYNHFSANKSSGIKDEESILLSFDGIGF